MRSPTRPLPAALAALFVLVSTLATGTVRAATVDERAASTRAAGAWLVTQFDGEGFVPDANGDPDYSNTAQSALALAAAEREQATFDRAVARLQRDVEQYLAPGGGDDSVGALGYLLLLADAAGLDPTDFGGVDLLARLGSTLGDREPGLYGAADPTFDGVFRQSLALLGLAAHAVAPPASAPAWLAGQQCGPGSPAASIGGWEAYRADTAVPCGPPDPVNFVGPDSNSTALAVQALAAWGVAPPGDALGFLSATQDDEGGWGFVQGADVDPNSTALVIQALASRGEDPESAPWRRAGGSPFDSLLRWQITDGEPGDVGAFASAFSSGLPDQYATQQSVWGVAGRAFPFGPVRFTGSSASPTTPTTAGGATVAPPAPTAAAQPRFTG